MYGYIYKTTNLINNKIYVGQHTSDCFDVKYKGSGTVLAKAIKKYGWDNFVCEILCECDSIEELNAKEMEFITKLDSTNPTIGYNIKYGGSNSPCPEIIKKKISETQKLNPNRSMLGRKHSDKTKEQMSKSSIGKKKSDEARKHMSIAKMGNSNNHHCNKNRIWINNGTTEIMISELDFDKYSSQNFIRGRLLKTDSELKKLKEIYSKKVYINNSVVEKCVNKDELDNYLLKGWQIGILRTYYKDSDRSKKISEALKGRIVITNGVVTKTIKPDEMPSYECQGYYRKSKRKTQ